MSNASTQALDTLKREIEKEDRELRQKLEELKRKEAEVMTIKKSIEQIEAKKQQTAEELKRIQQELVNAMRK